MYMCVCVCICLFLSFLLIYSRNVFMSFGYNPLYVFCSIDRMVSGWH